MTEFLATQLETMRNEYDPGTIFPKVVEHLNGGSEITPATYLALREATQSYENAVYLEEELIREGFPFNPVGLYTPESLINLDRLAEHTSRGASIWVLQPGISLQWLKAGLLKVDGQKGKILTNWLSAASTLNIGANHPDIIASTVWTTLSHGDGNCSAYHPLKMEDEAKSLLAHVTPGNPVNKIVSWESSGGGANTIAMEAALLHQQSKRRFSRKFIVTLEKAYHGNNGPAGQATDFGISQKYQNNCTITLPFPHDKQSTAEFMNKYSDLVSEKNFVAGILLEAIQGDGGMRVMTQEAAEFLTTLNEENEVMSIWDEVQSGMGRSGKFLAVEHLGEKVANSPINAFTMAKALANGFPISAAIYPKRFDSFEVAGSLSTMMGISIGLVRMMTAIKAINQSHFLEAVRLKGQMALEMLNNVANPNSHLRGGRGLGLMLGAEFTKPNYEYTDPNSSMVTPAICYLGGCGILAGGVENNGLRLHPRLTTSPEAVIATMRKVIEAAQLLDSEEMPQEVFQMSQAGRSGLDLK